MKLQIFQFSNLVTLDITRNNALELGSTYLLHVKKPAARTNNPENLYKRQSTSRQTGGDVVDSSIRADPKWLEI